MWRQMLDEIRRAGWRKIIVLLIAAAVAIALAIGADSSNNEANGQTVRVTRVYLAPTVDVAHRPR